MLTSLSLSAEEFASRRRKAQTDIEARLLPFVTDALKSGSWTRLMEQVVAAFFEEFRQETGTDYTDNALKWKASILDALERGEHIAVRSANQVALWLATAVLTHASIESASADEGDVFLEWVDMHDSAVRASHRVVSGQVRPAGEKFDVDGVPMIGPGDITAPVEEWINCRCTLRPTLASEFASLTAGGTMNDQAPEQRPDGLGIPWHGVIAPEGVWSGDKRKFAEGALSWRPFPLPLTWQKQSADGHGGNVTVASIEDTFTDPETHLVWGWGTMLASSAEADEFVGLLAEMGRYGVSVDADSTTFELDEEAQGIVFTAARGASACAVSIPAFAEAYVQLGELPLDIKKKRDAQAPADAPADQGTPPPDANVPDGEMVKPDAPMPPDLTDTPGDAQKRDKKKTSTPAGRSDRQDLAVAPEFAADLQRMSASVPFVDVAPGKTEDGPGWITHPVDTDRLRDYWTKGPGAAKIAWGSPGDFNRCRALVAQYIKPQHLNGYCANRHYDALGFWPGRPVRALTDEFTLDGLPDQVLADIEANGKADAVSLVASVGIKAPDAWFTDPGFTDGDPRLVELEVGGYACPMTITDDGHVFGHIAPWDVCHLNSVLEGYCTVAPHSATDYAYFHNSGVVATDAGRDVPVGQITIGGGHAGPNLSMRAALAHYDSTSTTVCDIVVGEDKFGIWFNGWIRPGTTSEMVTALRASGVSGDWREVRGNLELIAALAVNVPGFGIPRPRATVKNQRQVSLVAAGVLAPREEQVATAKVEMAEADLDVAGLAEVIADQVIERLAGAEQRKAQMAALAAQVEEVVG